MDIFSASCTASADASSTLRYEEILIQREGEFLNLTTMWHAVGHPRPRHPNDWLHRSETRRLVLHLAKHLSKNEDAELYTQAANESAGSLVRNRGREGGILAHWQLALDYARFLSPAFHVWCNDAVRRSIPLHGGQPPCITTPMPALLEEHFGHLNHRLDTIDRHAADTMFLLTASQELVLGNRRPFSDRSQAIIRAVIASVPFNGHCPCCNMADVLAPGGKPVAGAQLDHFYSRALNRPEHGWLICKQCHERLTHGGYLVRFRKIQEFRAFQLEVLAFMQRQFHASE